MRSGLKLESLRVCPRILVGEESSVNGKTRLLLLAGATLCATLVASIAWVITAPEKKLLRLLDARAAEHAEV